AREGRYRWFRDQVSKDDVLLTAHHGDDQAETLLFRLMRGASVNGLGGIRPLSEVADLTILRPLLECSRQEILGYVQTWKLDYLVDPSNLNTAFDRNFLRHEVIPALEKRWPSTKPILARTAQSLCETQALLDEVAIDDLERCRQVDHGCRFFVFDAISRRALLTLSERRRQNVLRFWLRETGGITATEKALAEFIRQLQSGASAPLMHFNGSLGPRSVRVFRNGVFLLPESESSMLADRPQTESWDGSNVRMNGVDVLLEARPVLGAGVRRDCIEGRNLEWRWRKGRTALRPANGSGRSRRLRILFQEMGIPPWERERMPMLFADGEFVCVPGLVIDQAFAASRDVPGLRLELSDLRSTGVRPVR
ncbi:MAG: tRNA lysidine(34) synthetase TilS, partial [Gammaproteobacteria bacterium]